MARPKKEVEIIEEKIILAPDIIRVMDRETRQVIKIDANKCPEYKTKYLHCMGKEFLN